MLVLRTVRMLLLASGALSASVAAFADTAPVSKRVYAPADFARFAPKSA